MKFLSVIAASLAAYASAQQQKPSFRGATNSKYSPKQQNNFPQYNRWQQKGGSKDGQYQRPQRGGSRFGQKGGSKDGQYPQKGGYTGKGRYPQKGGSQCPPTFSKELQKQYTDEFNAMDVDGNHVLTVSEFKDQAEKITEAFSSFRQHKKPSWYHKRPSRSGRGGSNQYGGKPQYGGKNQYGKPQYGGNSNDNNRPQRGFGGRRLAADAQSFMDYLKSHGFHMPTKDQPKKTQKDKDTADVKRAMQVFSKFDKDGNKSLSLCEYENAMYRTQLAEKMMQQKGGNNKYGNNKYGSYNRYGGRRGGRNNRGNNGGDVVVVHG